MLQCGANRLGLDPGVSWPAASCSCPWHHLLATPLPLHSPTHLRRLDDRSLPQMPAGFGTYLQVAGLIAFLLPVGALLALAASGQGSAGLLMFGGYVLAFVPQALMEVKLFNREMGVGVF